jgi:hypothetical protein
VSIETLELVGMTPEARAAYLADWPRWSALPDTEIEAMAATLSPRWLFKLADYVAQSGNPQRAVELGVTAMRDDVATLPSVNIASRERGDLMRTILFQAVGEDPAARLYAQHVVRDEGLVEIEDAIYADLEKYAFSQRKRKRALGTAERKLGGIEAIEVWRSAMDVLPTLMLFHRGDMDERDRSD